MTRTNESTHHRVERRRPTPSNRRPAPTAAPATEVRTPTTRSPTELAAEQGVQPFVTVDDLRADFWPESEPVDDFVAAVRECRRNG